MDYDLDDLVLPDKLRQALAGVETRNAGVFAETVAVIANYQVTQHPRRTRFRRFKNQILRLLREGRLSQNLNPNR